MSFYFQLWILSQCRLFILENQEVSCGRGNGMRVEYKEVTAIRSIVFGLKEEKERVLEMEAYCILK